MVIENIGLSNFLVRGKVRYIVWEYYDFYSHWNGKSEANVNVWIVPGTI